ncbi:DUF2971 domain-containing protein [Sphingomonas sp.]|uniref:DUF2971 domain-containing protein n=1 Tax=Sphingomonas sp. TaxID=28214 RepID=UPI0028AB96E5|nr:DUF2971 domain-containing protein [Sphingomonas sp.]
MALKDMTEAEVIETLEPVFQPYAVRKIAEARASGQRFVHYTSCEAAISIIENNSMWLRNATLMNDFSEIQHGLGCLQAYWHHERGANLKAAIRDINPAGIDAIAQSFDANIFDLLNNTFLISVSEHDASEDDFGRLSMWRAYGKTTGAALVFKNEPLLAPTSAITAMTIPVRYASHEQFASDMDEIAKNMRAHAGLLRELEDREFSKTGGSLISQCMAQVFRFACVATKHRGFEEEREWRVVYQPGVNPTHPDRISPATCTLNGVPQNIHKIFFKNYPEDGFVGATLPEIVDRVIIGPTAHPFVIFSRMFEALQSHGVDPAGVLINSHIPLRH